MAFRLLCPRDRPLLLRIDSEEKMDSTLLAELGSSPPGATEATESDDMFLDWYASRRGQAEPERESTPTYKIPEPIESSGHILSIHGSVIDVSFQGELPRLNEALTVVNGSNTLVLEVQQILSPQAVRTLALGQTNGLARGLVVERTEKQVRVPVGPTTLGRVLSALGAPLDGQAAPVVKEYWPIHRPIPVSLELPRPAPKILETGIKVIDLLAPVAQAGTTGVIGGAGLGKTILLHEMIRTMGCKQNGVVVFAGVGERTREANELWLEMRASGASANSILVLGQMSEPAGTRFRAALSALTMAEYFRDVESKEVLLLIDSVSRHLQSGCEVSGVMGRLPSEMGYQPTLATDLGMLEGRIAVNTWSGITSIQAIYVPADDPTDPIVAGSYVHLDTSILLSRARFRHGLFPAVDPIASDSRLLDPNIVGQRHFDISMRVKETIQRFRNLNDIISMLGMQELKHEDQVIVRRARRLDRFLTQPFFSTESFTGHAGQHVPLKATLAGCEAILNGKCDDMDERQLYMIGGLEGTPVFT